MAEKVRTFVAVEVPAEVRDRMRKLVDELRVTDAKVKWSDTKDLHWTLKFLGDVDLREVPDVCEAVTQAVADLTSFDIVARGAGAFPDLRRPRTVWIGTGEGSDEMVELHDRIERALAKLGYRAEGRRFRPHVTLGRVRNSPHGLRELADLIQKNADYEAGISTVFEVVVFSSELGPKGPTYEPLGHAELKGAE